MSRRGKAEEVLSKAQALEKKYDWLEAAGLHEQALGMIAEDDFSRKGEIQERKGYCFHKAAFQADAKEEFKQRLQQSVEAYEKATELYGKPSKLGKTAWVHRCEAMMAYNGYWLASEAAEKKRLINECWKLTKEALKAFEDAKAALEYGKTFNQLSSSSLLAIAFEWTFQPGAKIVGEAKEHGERTITLLSKVGDSSELAKAYAKTASCLAVLSFYFDSDISDKERHHEQATDYWQKALKSSEETAFLELLSVSFETLAWSTDEMLAHYGAALEYATKTEDKLLRGTALDWLAYATSQKTVEIEDPDKRRENSQKALNYATDAKSQFSSISFSSPRGTAFWTEAPEAEYHLQLASWEPNLRRRRDLLEKAISEGARAFKQAESTGYPHIMRYAHRLLARSLTLLARIETDLKEKKKLLEKALEHNKEALRIGDELERFAYWNLGMLWSALGVTRAELSDFERDSESRRNMLEEALSCRERGLQLCLKEFPRFEKKGFLQLSAALGNLQYWNGTLLNRLYKLTNESKYQRRAIEAFEEASQSYHKMNLVSRMAECNWKAASSRDGLGEHLRAAENFDMASDNYRSAAEKIPQLKSFYEDHAKYMEAWSEIEKARHHHGRQEYGLAKEHFEKAAVLHGSLKKWKYLTSNYSAWAQVESGEYLSRQEQTEEAIEAFKQATELFNETRSSFQVEIDRMEDGDEKTMAVTLAKSADLRREYCVGRIALEEARILDRKGDHYSSSQKYGAAAEKFEKILGRLESEQDRKEFKLMTTLSRAWEKMTRAESEISPTFYSEASQLFEEAKELSPNERAKMLTLGHSRFCKALEAGTKFADAGDTTFHTAALKHLESAAKYYTGAGVKYASEYARATGLLFDAYKYMGDAKKENDPGKKAKFYKMAEKVLQTSAGSFMKAEHPEKREQVARLLEKVKEEQELALSLSEVLHAPSIVSTTTAFNMPAPTQESAVGLERFENADVQANLLLRVKEVRVGEDVDFRLELINAGKAPALLIKVDEIMPEGFEIKEVPEVYTVEDSYLNLKGKRLNPLKTEDVRIVVRPELKGTHVIKPRILYIDETGKYKSHEPEPVTLTVKELGISGWIKGEK